MAPATRASHATHAKREVQVTQDSLVFQGDNFTTCWLCRSDPNRLHRGGRGFESLIAHHEINYVEWNAAEYEGRPGCGVTNAKIRGRWPRKALRLDRGFPALGARCPSWTSTPL